MKQPTNERMELIRIRETSKSFADRVLNYLQFGAKTLDMKLSNRVLDFYKILSVDGYISVNNPKATAGALIYINAILEGYNTTQYRIAKVFGISSGTLRRHYTKLKALYDKFRKETKVKEN